MDEAVEQTTPNLRALPPVRRESLVSNLAEFVGVLMLVAFAYLVWPPASLLTGGLVLILWANRRESTGTAFAAVREGFTAARDAWRAAQNGR